MHYQIVYWSKHGKHYRTPPMSYKEAMRLSDILVRQRYRTLIVKAEEDVC